MIPIIDINDLTKTPEGKILLIAIAKLSETAYKGKKFEEIFTIIRNDAISAFEVI